VFFAGDTFGICIVNSNNMSIRSEIEIAFDAIGATLPGQIKSCQGILWGIGRGTAMANDQLRGGKIFDMAK